METKMSKPNYLLKRGPRYYVRVRIPTDLLNHPRYQKKKEVVKSLGTSDYKEACKLVRDRAREIHLEFDRALEGYKTAISDQEAELLCSCLLESRLAADEEARYSGDLIEDEGYERHLATIQQNETAAREVIARGKLDALTHQATDWLTGAGYHLDPESEAFRRFVLMFARRSAESNKAVRARDEGEPVATPKATSVAPGVAPGGVLMLGDLTKRFLDKADQSKPMFSKYSAVLPLFLEFVGNKPITQLKQLDVENFCHFICKLPPRWKDAIRQKKITVQALAELTHEKTISPKTYEDTYIAALRPFLSESKRVYGEDHGFPLHLTTDGIAYTGNRKAGEAKQRPMTANELKALFEGEYMTEARADQKTEHEFWFPLVGLYTGARVNEVCQLNPQTDIRQEEGVWVFDFTDEGETDARVTKSVKNDTSRRIVPVHDKLIELGFLKYVERVKKASSKLLFPQWAPSVGKASAGAREWFGELLKELKLRDETPGKTLTGYHAFRFTMENRATNLEVDNIRLIVGHAGSKTTVERGYEGAAKIATKKRILDRIWFDLSL